MTVITKNLVLEVAGSTIDHARIGHASFTLDSDVTVTASTAAAGFSEQSILNSLTYERWKPLALPATLTVQLPSAQFADYVGIAAHTLGSTRSTLAVEYSFNGTDYTTLQQFAPPDNTPIMILFGQLSALYWRLRIVAADSIPYIGVFYVGKALTMQRMIYGGISSPKFNFDTKVLTNESNTGQTLGRTVIRSGINQSFSWRHLTRDWCDNNVPAFLTNAQNRAFFVAWRPHTHTEDVIFGETQADPQLTNMGIRNYLEMSFSMRGVVTQ